MDAIKLEAMKEVLKIQGSTGNWDYDEYMMGMYNGMELMMAIAENREPVFKEVPKEWLHDKPLYNIEPPVTSKPVTLTVLPGGKYHVTEHAEESE